METLYIQDTSWGFGVFRNGYLIQEFETEDEAWAYIVFRTESKGE